MTTATSTALSSGSPSPARCQSALTADRALRFGGTQARTASSEPDEHDTEGSRGEQGWFGAMSYVARRVGFFLVTLWAALTFNFFLPRLMPGNPALAMLSRLEAKGHLGPQALHTIEIALGLNHHQGLLHQ